MRVTHMFQYQNKLRNAKPYLSKIFLLMLRRLSIVIRVNLNATGATIDAIVSVGFHEKKRIANEWWNYTTILVPFAVVLKRLPHDPKTVLLNNDTTLHNISICYVNVSQHSKFVFLTIWIVYTRKRCQQRYILFVKYVKPMQK